VPAIQQVSQPTFCTSISSPTHFQDNNVKEQSKMAFLVRNTPQDTQQGTSQDDSELSLLKITLEMQDLGSHNGGHEEFYLLVYSVM
jgi:hypothetical protein